MSWLRGVAAVAGVELVRLGRDRTSFLFVLVLPVIVILVIGSTFAANATALPVGLVVERDGPVVAAFEASEVVSLRRYDQRDDLVVAVRSGAVTGGVVVDGSTVTLLSDVASPTASAVRTAVGGIVAAEAAVLAVAAANDLDPDAVRVAARGVARVEVVRRSVDDGGDRVPSAFSYTAPANLVLFTFINSLAVGAAIVASRQLGVLRRWRASPVRRSALVAGLVASRLGFALVQAVLIMAIGGLVFGVQWGDPVAVAVLVTAFALVATGVGVLAGVAARTPEQTAAVGVPLGIGLGMLGGCMWPLEQVGDTMRTAGHATPHAWAMDGFLTLVFDGGGLADIGVEVAVLVGYAALVLGVALALADRRLR